MCGVNSAIHTGNGMTKLLHSSLFMVFMTALSFFAIKGLLPCSQLVMKFFYKQVALNMFGHPVVMTLQ